MTQIEIDCVARNASSASLSPYCGQPSPALANGGASSGDLKKCRLSETALSRPLSRTGSDSDEFLKFEVPSQVGAQCSYRPLHERIEKRVKAGTPFFSLEFFPPKTANGVANFYTRLDRYKEGDPLFVDITWHYGGDPANLTRETSSSSIAAGCLDYCRMDTMLHMTCTQYTKEQTIAHLEQSKRIGLRNILALRGDLPPNTSSDAPVIKPKYMALDMIKWIKEEFGDYFTIACSGYPLGHPEAVSYAEDLKYLKAKVDAGAQLIVTQLFFEAEAYERFVRDCREMGITVPILPGIMPIQSYDSIRRIAQLSQLAIPDSILADLEPIKHDDDAVRNYGRHRAIEMCRRILSNGTAPAIHMYTMNREGSCREILQELGLWHKRPMRALPWEPHGVNHPLRCKEDVRPIFWSARPKSYIYRTRDWDDFPNGRWGNSSSPAFNDLHDYYLFNLHSTVNEKDKLRDMFGHELRSIDDVGRVFARYIDQQDNEHGVKVTTLPWNEQENGVQAETSLISDDLVWCNERGVLTLNSQPSVNGAPSTDPLVGWGKPGGYCYQKAYLECFISAENAASLLEFIDEHHPRINYHIVNKDGSMDRSNAEATTPIAVTWGVFPGAEIAQPTVVDPISFRVWRDEAYDMWMKNWAYLYPADSRSHQVIEEIHNSFCLLTLVDNDFVHPSILFDVVREMVARTETRTASSSPKEAVAQAIKA
ncbi:mthf-1 [Pristionchus pacificus]|uniref:methylenetetrahydrofolate reductase (NADPH) n=1 Tax=Pristionchus pacificus TaxID=54126 RepID=A0A2A6CWW5_PRIPA|nr:mthf-1 [Pristionchus pacificus]|eukprot:PDM82523.1 mthf-1 [Pristionchus pacificus]